MNNRDRWQLQMGRYAAALAILVFLGGCAKKEENPVIFLPKFHNPQVPDAEARRELFCAPARVSFRDKVLTDANIRAVFDCANYDYSIEPLRKLIFSGEFPRLRQSITDMVRSDSTKNLREILTPWFQENSEGKSRLDRFLPTLVDMIRSPAFREGLRVLERFLDAGKDTWAVLLPELSYIVYDERFPDTISDLQALFRAEAKVSAPEAQAETDPDYTSARRLKVLAQVLSSKMRGRTVAEELVAIAGQVKDLELPGTTIAAYLDEANEKGVFVSLYQESSELRGEVIDERLNSDPDLDELEQGLNLTPAERQERAMLKLLGGERPPLVQLAELMARMNKQHPDFIPAVGRWVSANGDRVGLALHDYVAGAYVRAGIGQLDLEQFLLERFRASGKETTALVDGIQFSEFLKKELSSPEFALWAAEAVNRINTNEFGERNAQLFRTSGLEKRVIALYGIKELPEFGLTLVPANKTQAFNTVARKFGNWHRTERLLVKYGEKTQKLESHLIDIWTKEARDHLGESIVVKFAIKLVQTFLTDFANNFDRKHPDTSLAQWYFDATYSNPGTTEFLASYIFKELNFLQTYEEKKEWMRTDLAKEIFPDAESDPVAAENLRSFQMLVDQIPNIWLYIKSGYARSSHNLNRALSEKDRGNLIKRYVDLLADATDKGLVAKAVPIMHRWKELRGQNADLFKPEDNTDDLARRRRISRGADALKRVFSALLEPRVAGDYKTATLDKLLMPIKALVAETDQASTARFLLILAQEIEKTSDEKLQKFLEGFRGKENESPSEKRERMEALAEILRKKQLPDVLKAVNGLLRDDAVAPSLEFLAAKYDSGSLNKMLLFVRRILGIKERP